MNPNEYQQLALRTEVTPPFINDNEQLSRLTHGAIGICTEVGELQDMLKKHLMYGAPLDLVNAMEEASDVLWYVALVLDAAGYTMEQAMERNIAKLKARYPVKFTPELALNRDLEVEKTALTGTGGCLKIFDNGGAV